MGVAHNGLEGLRGEERPPRQGHFGHALADIRQALRLGHGADGSVDDAALRHTAASPAPQLPQQRRLADQHQVEEGLRGGGQVREHQQLLEGLAGQVLRLIDDERHHPALVGLIPEALLQLGQQGLGRRHRHREMAGQQSKDLLEGEVRMPAHNRSELRRCEAG